MNVETINTFDIEALRLGPQEFCEIFNDCLRSKVENDSLIPTVIRIDGNFTVLKCKYIGMRVFSLGINKDDTKNIELFNRVKEQIGKLCEGPVVIGQANRNNDFKPWRVDWDKNLNANIYSGLYDRVNIPIWKLVKGNKKKRISIESIANKKFYGSCVIGINEVLVDDSVEKLNLEVGEILVKEMAFTKSLFKEYAILREEEHCGDEFNSN